MNNWIVGALLVVFGAYAVVFRSFLAHLTVEWNYKLIGVKYSRAMFEAISGAIGLLFFVLGLAALLKMYRV